MANPGRGRTAKEHAFAQALDLARRQAGLSTEQLSTRLYVSARSVRRYQSAERRPTRQVVAAWEDVCGVEDGRLLALFAALDVETDPAAAPAGGVALAGRGGTRRRWPWAAGAVIGVVAVVVLAVLVLGDDDDGGGDARRTTAATVPTATVVGAVGAPSSWDHQDPMESGCSKTPEVLASAPVLDSGRRVGTLELKGSTACQTGWPRVILDREHAAPFVLEVVRPSDGARDRYVFSKPSTVVFGNMLKHDRGCLVAGVRVGPPATGLRARTPCRK
jgi:transcriptional regulator with XRE-family HTH domain